MAVAVFIDTWGWVAMACSSEECHRSVVKCYQSIRDQKTSVYTSDYVLTEVITMLFKRKRYEEAFQFVSGILEAADQGNITIERITATYFDEAWKLRQKYQDKPRISFTDLTSMTIMKKLDIQDVMTDDDHFLHVGMGFRQIPSKA